MHFFSCSQFFFIFSLIRFCGIWLSFVSLVFFYFIFLSRLSSNMRSRRYAVQYCFHWTWKLLEENKSKMRLKTETIHRQRWQKKILFHFIFFRYFSFILLLLHMSVRILRPFAFPFCAKWKNEEKIFPSVHNKNEMKLSACHPSFPLCSIWDSFHLILFSFFLLIWRFLA